MEKLTAFAKQWQNAREDGFGCWVGDISDVRESERVTTIARRAGYAPESRDDFFEISRRTAARVLAYVQKESLAYGQRRYREGLARDMSAMLGELGPAARFWSNSRHSDFEPASPVFTPDNAWMWIGLTEATFDTGVIACNEETGFIFWIEEED
ncbi:MAG: hypothetical protein RIB03_10535 [Henriciella sp.]|uniref:hypothetical protein n=1 Tax=Henriciella sp. TaxID=1968823 RepID=UPI00262710A1|nr:hypothetical protein [Henriciella sp.]